METIKLSNTTMPVKPIFRNLFICGILSSMLYFATDILASIQYGGYNYISQCFSELQASGAPTRLLVVVLMSIYNLLIILLAFAIIFTDKRKRALITGLMLIGYALSGEVTTLLFPMHMRGVEATVSDTMHANLTYVFVLFTLLFIGFASTLHGKRFFFYSMATILILVLFGTLAGMDGPLMAENLPTPWLGIKERINIYVSLIWILVMAVKSLKMQNNAGAFGKR